MYIYIYIYIYLCIYIYIYICLGIDTSRQSAPTSSRGHAARSHPQQSYSINLDIHQRGCSGWGVQSMGVVLYGETAYTIM